MKKLKFLGLLSLLTINFLCADEYISDDYFEEITSQSEVTYESMESLPITQTVEEKAREENQKNEIRKEELILLDKERNKVFNEEIVSPHMREGKQSIQANSYLNALKQARSEKKIIMLSIRSIDCKYCDRMEAETLSDSSVKEAIEDNFININYNQDLDVLPLNLQEGATPMFIFVNTNEDIINMYPGMRSPAEFKEALSQILAE